MLDWSLFVAAAYAVGSVPVGFLIGRARGVDLREAGSGNIGATNAGRVLGRRWGALCFLLDVLKGAAPVLAAGAWTGAIADERLGAADEAWWCGVALAAIVGHVCPVWLGFRGGKGVATSLGALGALWPIATVPAAAALAVWLGFAVATRYVGLSSVAAAVALPVAAWVASRTAVWGERAVWPALAMMTLLAGLVIWRHRGNLARTWRGEEPRIGGRRGASGGDKSAPGPADPDR